MRFSPVRKPTVQRDQTSCKLSTNFICSRNNLQPSSDESQSDMCAYSAAKPQCGISISELKQIEILLIAGNNIENNHAYYQLAEIAALGDINGIKLIINIPLKTADTFCCTEQSPCLRGYLRISLLNMIFIISILAQRKTNATISWGREADLLRSKASSITIYSANTAVYHARALTCQASSFFQTADSYSLCWRSLLLHQKFPTLQ